MRIKPRQISAALVLLWLSIVASPVRSMLEWTHIKSLGSYNAGVPIDLTLFLAAFLIWKIGQRSNWGRFALLAAFVAGLIPYFSTLKVDMSQSRAVGALEVAGVVFQSAALALLFTRPGREWFQDDPDQDISSHDS
jgi:ABC-type transport system involved in cytochrome c biogenesis permease subunit